MSNKKIVGIVISDTKVWFSVFERSFPNIEKIKPVDLAISFYEGKVVPFGEAYKRGTCISSLTNCTLLQQKIANDENCKKYADDVFKLWVLMMKKIKDCIVSKVEGPLEYIIAIPETNQNNLRDVIYIACETVEMKVLRVFPMNFCAMMGFQANSFYSRKDGDGYSPKLMFHANLDDDHTTFTTFYVSREKIIKIHSLNARLGQSTFVQLAANHILGKSGLNTGHQLIDFWELKHRKKLGDFYSAINAFSESNVTKTYYRDDDENVTPVTKEEFEQVFAQCINFLCIIAKKVQEDSLAILKSIEIPEINKIRDLRFCHLICTGEHKNAFVINALERELRATNDTTINSQQLIAEGCGWMVGKMELKGMSDSQQADQQHAMYVYERTIPIESIIAPQSICLTTVGQTQQVVGIYPSAYQMSTEPIDIPNSQPGKYNVLSVDCFYAVDGQFSQETPSLGLMTADQPGFSLLVSKSFGFMDGLPSTFEANKQQGNTLIAVELGCENKPSSGECGPNGEELKKERFSKTPQFDEDLDCVVYRNKGMIFGLPVTVYGAPIQNQYAGLNVEAYKRVFELEDSQNQRIELASQKASEIRTKRSKVLIDHIGQSRRKDVIKDMNKIIKQNKDDPDKLEAAWRELVRTLAGDSFTC